MSAAKINLDDKALGYIGKLVKGVPVKSVQAVIGMHLEGATVPFMARYRKEKTGNMDEGVIRDVLNAYEEFGEYSKRQEFVLEEIGKQGQLTDDLKKRLLEAKDLAEIEEIYRPYKRKKKTKATMAREAGLEPLSDWIWSLGHGELKDDTTLEVKAKEFINPAHGFTTYEEVLRGAQHILVEKISNQPELRQKVREDFLNHGKIVSAKTAEYKPHSKYEMYAEFSEPVKNLMQKKASHRYLALRRGWQEGELKVSMEGNQEAMLKLFEGFAYSTGSQPVVEFLKTTAKQALTVHVEPSITNEIHTEMKNQADMDAIQVFADNVRRVLMASPFGSKVVLGVDPGIRTGCKLALVDKSGHFMSHTVLYIQNEGEDAKEKAKKLFQELLKQIKIDAVAVGNGTGGREAETFMRQVFKDLGTDIPVVMISEAGASVYSASEVAREEFPDLDVTVRGAISIARRLQDPLSELVKIEPKSIGVGQYQHDVNQPKLKKSLHEVVESSVNLVGVDVNTASTSLLQYVAGIGPATARNIVEHRKKIGLFKQRDELLKVPQLSTKVYEQAAGFLRIHDGKMVLDRTGVHPERYSAIREMAGELDINVTNLIGEGAKKLLALRTKWAALIGEFTFDDIVKELEKPGRDPRSTFKVFQYRDDIHELKDLKQGMICPGIVTNVTNFGAFVDIGVHQDGLVHISELSDQFVDDPKKVVNPGDQVQIRVLAVDLEKKQISLSMKLEDKPQVKTAAQQAQQRPQGQRNDQRPGGAKPQGPRPQGGKPQHGGGRPQHQQNARPAPKPFNNPFAALAGLKDDKK